MGAALNLLHQAHIRYFSALTTAFGRAVGRTRACSLSAHHFTTPLPLCLQPTVRRSPRLLPRLVVLTPAHQAQLHQVVVDVGAKDLDEEEVEVTAFQRHPGEAAEQAVVGEPPQHLAGCWLGPTRESTVEQEGQVEEEKAAHKVHVQPQVGAESLLGSEPAPEHPQREQKRCGSQLSRAPCCITAD